MLGHIIKTIDPEGVNRRRRRRLHRRSYVTQGPNYVWHIDGHDKLKPFGFSIHGCIDGFSRKLMWLEVGTTNKMPEVIAKFYLDAGERGWRHRGGILNIRGKYLSYQANNTYNFHEIWNFLILLAKNILRKNF